MTMKSASFIDLALFSCSFFIAFFQFVSVGTGFGFSIMYAEIVHSLGVSRFKASLIQGLYLGLTLGAGLLWSDFIQKFGTGLSSVVGLIASVAGLFSCAFVKHVELIVVLAGVVSGIGMSICYLTSIISVSIAFREDPRVPLAFLTIGSSLGQFVVPLLHSLFIVNYFWSGAFMLIAALVLQCVPFGILIHLMLKQDENRNVKETVTRPNICDKELLKDYVLWIILINCHLLVFTGNVEAWFIVDQLKDIGFTVEKGSILVSVLGFGNLCGRVIGSIMKFKWRPWPTIYHWLYLCPIVATGHALVLYYQHTYPLLSLICFLHATAFGITNAQMTTIVYEATGPEKYPAAVAFMNLFVGTADIISLMFGGTIFDILGSYDVIYYSAIVESIFVTAGSLVVSYHVRKTSREMSNGLMSRKLPNSNYSTLGK